MTLALDHEATAATKADALRDVWWPLRGEDGLHIFLHATWLIENPAPSCGAR
jgi:hypothetical protein